jgi:hypothetical protein
MFPIGSIADAVAGLNSSRVEALANALLSQVWSLVSSFSGTRSPVAHPLWLLREGASVLAFGVSCAGKLIYVAFLLCVRLGSRKLCFFGFCPRPVPPIRLVSHLCLTCQRMHDAGRVWVLARVSQSSFSLR